MNEKISTPVQLKKIWMQRKGSLSIFIAFSVSLVFLFIYNNCSGYGARQMQKGRETSNIYNLNSEMFASLANGSVAGNVERLIDNGSTMVLSGWACIVGSEGSGVIKAYVNNKDIGTTTTDITREDAVKTICNSKSYQHGFSLVISGEEKRLNGGGAITVTIGGQSVPGSLTIPKAAQPPPPVISGYLEGLEYQNDQSFIVRGWACLQGSSQAAQVTINAGATILSTVTANVGRGSAVQSACGSSTTAHGFELSVPAVTRAQYKGLTVTAKASVGGVEGGLMGSFTILEVPANPVVQSLPYTAYLTTPFVGSGGSTWNHQVTLKSRNNDGTGNFKVYSSSQNDRLIPSFLESANDLDSVKSGSCLSAGSEDRSSADGKTKYIVSIEACFTKVGEYDWDIYFTHVAQEVSSMGKPATKSPSHGTIQLRAPH